MLNYYHLFSLPEAFYVDETALRQAYQRLQAQYHPDRHLGKSPEDQHRVLLMASEVNRGWQVLRSPVERAALLLKLRTGLAELPAVNLEPQFLLEQIDWREQLELAESVVSVENCRQQLSKRLKQESTVFAQALECSNWLEATLRQAYMQFFQRLDEEALRRIERLEEER